MPFENMNQRMKLITELAAIDPPVELSNAMEVLLQGRLVTFTI